MAEARDTPVLDLLARMHADAIKVSNLEPKTFVLVRLAALVALDAPAVSYALNLALADNWTSIRSRFGESSRHWPRSSGRCASPRRWAISPTGLTLTSKSPSSSKPSPRSKPRVMRSCHFSQAMRERRLRLNPIYWSGGSARPGPSYEGAPDTAITASPMNFSTLPP